MIGIYKIINDLNGETIKSNRGRKIYQYDLNNVFIKE